MTPEEIGGVVVVLLVVLGLTIPIIVAIGSRRP